MVVIVFTMLLIAGICIEFSKDMKFVVRELSGVPNQPAFEWYKVRLAIHI